jgi:hypothetical protein
MSDNKPNRNPADLTDLLFSVLFGATFAFKLGILAMGYGLNLSQALVPYGVFFGYSILFVVAYWEFIRIETIPLGRWSRLATPLVFVVTIVESMAPYPALSLALWWEGRSLTQDEMNSIVIGIFIQVAAVVFVGTLKRYSWHSVISSRK